MSHSPASEEKKALLRKVCADALRVMPSHTPVTFNGEPSYATFLPPTEILKNTRHAYLSFEKRPMWQPIPEGAILDHKFLKMKHHVVPDPTWVPPVKERPPPSPVFPRSRGIKLRDVDTIIKEDRMLRSLSEEEREAYSSSRKPQQQGPSQPPNKPPPLPKKPDPVMDIINEITAASRHLSSAPHPSTTKSSIPSSSNPNNKTTPTTATVTTPIQSSSKNKEDGTPRKKSNSTTSGRPTTSGKGVKSSAELSKAQSVHGRSTPEQRKPSPPIYSHISLHDLLIARDFMPLHMDDPVVNRKLSQLKEKSTTKNKPKYARPILRLHVKLKVPEAKRSRSKETLPETQLSRKTTPLRSKKSVSAAVESEREDDTMATKAQPRAEISRERSKSAAARDRSMERSPDAAKQSITRKPSPRKPSPVPHRAVKKESTPVSGDMTSQDDAQPPAKWSLPTGTIPTEFIRSMKIPKRTRSEPKPEEKPSLLPTKRIKEQEVELEEGETISPSPSPMGPIAATTTIEVPLDTKRRRQTTSDREMPRHRSSRKDSHDRKESRHRGGDDRDEDDRRRHSRKESRRYDDDRLGDDRRKAKRDSRSLEEERYDDDRRKLHRKNSRSYDDDDKPDRSQRRDSRHSSSSYTEKSRRGGAGMSPIARSPSVSRKLSSTSSSESNHRKTPTADTLLQRPSSTSLEGAVSPNLASQKLSPMTGSTVTPDTKDLQKGLSMSPRHGSKDLSTKPSSTVEPDQHSSSEKATPPVPAPSTHASSTTHLSIDKAGASSSVSSQSPTPHHSYLNATAPDAESPSQLKMYSIMFLKLATAHKRRGDHASTEIAGILDHMHAILNYILTFFYHDKLGQENSQKNWDTLHPFTDVLLKKLRVRKDMELYGLCLRMSALVHFYSFSRREVIARTKIARLHGSETSYDKDKVAEYSKLADRAMLTHEQAYGAFRESDKYMSYAQIQIQFPQTFQNVCVQGELGPGIVLGGEAGKEAGPMFPFAPFSRLHHAAIMAKCILAEYVEKNGLKYTPITSTDDYM